MLPFRIRGMILVHNLLLSLAAAGLFWIWIVTHFVVFRATDIEWVRYGSYSLVVIAALAVDFVVSQLRGTDILQLDLRAALKLSLRQTVTTLLAVLTFLVFFKDQGMSRLFLLTFVPILYALLLFLNVVVPPVLARLLFLTKRREQTLLVGSGEQARRLLDWCKGKTLYGLDVIGLVTDHHTDELHDFPIFGRVEELEEVVLKSGATQLIALNSLSSQERSDISILSDKLGVRLLLVSSGGDHVTGNGTFTEGGFHFFSPREEPLECPFNRIIKKSLDVTLSIPIVLLVLPPLALFVKIVHHFQSPGPLFFRQKRTGINYKTFWIYKFRTMHLNHGTENQQATAHDPRVFTFGRWLRKLSIDELPQFLNVLKGEMSIVGPRPHMVEHTELFVKVASEFHVRTLVKPGITGLAQVRGYRGETATKEDVLLRVASDVYYLENWSPILEGSIILRTILHLMRPPKSAC